MYCNISFKQTRHSAPISHSKTHTYFAPLEHIIQNLRNPHHALLNLPTPFALRFLIASSFYSSWTTMSSPALQWSNNGNHAWFKLLTRLTQNDYNVDMVCMILLFCANPHCFAIRAHSNTLWVFRKWNMLRAADTCKQREVF